MTDTMTMTAPSVSPPLPLLEIRNLTKRFSVHGGGVVRAVENVSFTVGRGETFALVGESGCGKTTLTKLVLGLEKPTSGEILFHGADLAKASAKSMHAYRRQAQAVFQDPYSSLNPRMRVNKIIAEPLMAHGIGDKASQRARVLEMLDVVGLPRTAADLYPHEFSGGQRQRVAIARALALKPAFMVLDEPISALDVSVRAQILNLLADIQDEFGLTYLIVAHDLALVEHFSSSVGVMYLGSMAELGPTETVFSQPKHPYTQALLASVPRPDPDHRAPVGVIHGEIGSAMAPPPGCKFHPRCPYAVEICRTTPPVDRELAPRQLVACHLAETIIPPVQTIVASH
ncbi:MAG: Peptide/nickel transport system ATP-binding protein/oligopeptide transport system ATP-binding [Tardiphaga sp.]|uniref:ABC transporter ATP-binding protein n=1 Tax=Tardiphaga sp. TaxID=1926292 RepID=UPI0026207F3C|nr:oligopeptide/dipeptide ABC transporter ATP-binding protein [Tardiphaga sp.]MDB5503758.1 Peptide/nickel transport system ATP-binding protein/oligopeptide transport system ATP-binding [Tardiphaga sp.]